MRLWYVALAAVALVMLLARPQITKAQQPGIPIGSKVENLRFKDIRFAIRSIEDFGKRKAFVIVVVDSGCPLVPRYFPTLIRLDKEYREKGVQFIALNASIDNTIREMAQQALDYGVPFPFVRDIDGKCVAALGAERMSQVVVLDADHKIRYRGRIDDQYRPGGALSKPTHNDLKDALDELLAGKEVTTPLTPADGCKITVRNPNLVGKAPTFTEDIGPILHKNCAICHRPGGGGPFSLLTYEDARRRGAMAAEVVADGQMPPWYAGPAHDADFSNRRVLSPAERDTVARWVQGGMPRGNGPMPKPPEFAPPHKDGWTIGEPDVILETEVHELPAEGIIPYRNVALTPIDSSVPYVFALETWVSAIQILPDNPKVVHHANLAFGSLSYGIKEENFITGYVPGTRETKLPEGVAFRLPPLSALGLQIHYVATGKPEKCRIKVGLRYARGTVRQQLHFVLLDSTRFSIPAQNPHHLVPLGKPLKHDAVGIGIFAHMHLRGKAMIFRAHPPEGGVQTLLTIPNYNFDWQLSYLHERNKLKLPKGTRLECVAIFDNSSFNPYNPDPNATVRYGRQTHDEMINGFFFYVDEKEDLNLAIDPKTGRPKRDAIP